ncbi:hypothetical protein ASPZODRAFT_127547 [Penicilliopsis zonata CBS 506.65]|uniref:dihydroneopterin aldolase n=1 Tax=Penicilliopsis zonata CBS 506.65 TaxID=1073090 RepID=A0A1L9SW95_9EURO|nr:hypothetical protein ASPZODRAFT_127547 [Penicilliopsis zonata CBS 506.65]OJJ51472.1 hypothetical protein ASPZODRAFT_127547 [Penicilliopsis zonata CBS 506.65]
MKISYSSAVAAAAADDVSLSLDYGKLFRRLDAEVRDLGKQGAPGHAMVNVDGTQRDEILVNDLAQDVRLVASVVTHCGLDLLDETAAGIRRMAHLHVQTVEQTTSSTSISTSSSRFPINGDYGRCEVWLHLPKALLRAEGGLRYRSVTVWGYKQSEEEEFSEQAVVESGRRCPVVLEEEFRIEGIRCHCILGVNSHERVEKQAVIISLVFEGPGQLAWGSTVIDTYQAMTRAVAEKVEETSFQTVEALATFIARIATVDFSNERVTVTVEKPSALSFVERSGVEITRSQAFFEKA